MVDGLSCAPFTLQINFEDAKLVFLGKVISKEHVPDPFIEGAQDSVFQFEILETFKGTLEKEITLQNSEHFFGFPFEVGKNYVVFSHGTGDPIEEMSCSFTGSADSIDINQLQMLASSIILPPLKQSNLGIPNEEITCREGLELIFKSNDDSPACVKLSSVSKLIERGWASS